MKQILFILATCAYSFLALAQAPTSGLVAYWPLNGNYTNSINAAMNGTNFSSTASPNNSNAIGQAVQFANPTNSVVQYATHPTHSTTNFSGSNNFSVSFFAYINSPFIHSGGLYENNMNYGGYGIWFWNSSGFLQIQFNYKNGSVGTTNGAVPIGTWFHICCTRDAGTIRIYINGILNASNAEGSTASNYLFPARVGTMFSNSLTPPQYNGHHGRLDELRIYNRALSVTEIGQIQTLLPVKLTQFTATLHSQSTLLNWQTTHEQNSKHFEIERSVDGIHFQNIATVSASGNSSTLKNYSFSDQLNVQLQNEAILYYKIKMVDLDHQFTYSKIIPVKLNVKNLQINISPNPAINTAQIQINQLEKVNIHFAIMNSNGQIVKTFYKTNTDLAIVFSIDLHELPKGIYTIRATTTKEIINKSFVKSN